MLYDELKRLSEDKADAIELENALTDIFDLIKITHQVAMHGEDATKFDGDYLTSLLSSVSFLREKTDNFEKLYMGLE